MACCWSDSPESIKSLGLILAVNDDRTVKNAFYIPDGDRAAVIFSDGSMSMWQNSAVESDYQKQFDDPDFG